jgi:hypothetical protein
MMPQLEHQLPISSTGRKRRKKILGYYTGEILLRLDRNQKKKTLSSNVNFLISIA